MTNATIEVYCTLCGQQYRAPSHIRAYHNLCPSCYSADALREWDRIESARGQLLPGAPDTLKLSEWLHTVAAFHGKCCLCLQVPFSRLTLLDMARGLTAENAIPTCKACAWHYTHSFAASVERVIRQMEVSYDA